MGPEISRFRPDISFENRPHISFEYHHDDPENILMTDHYEAEAFGQ